MKIKFNINGMSCSACSSSIERAVGRLDGVKKAEVNLLSKSMLCEFDPKITDESAIIGAVEKAGFSAFTESAPKKPKTDPFTDVKTRLTISICFLVPLMYISMGHMIGLPLTGLFHHPENAVAFSFTQFILTLPILYVNRKFFFIGFKALAARSPNMDSLVAVGSAAAVAYGVFSIYMIGYGLGTGDISLVKSYSMNLYFESAAMILTLVTVGKFLEERAGRKTGSAIKGLMDLSPKKATVIRDGVETEIGIDDLVVGDILVIRPGESVPADGTVVEGASSVDMSALTGESVPADKTVGDGVLSASMNLSGMLKIKAEKVGKDTALSQIISLVENASASKAPIARLADKVSGVFVPIVMAIAVISVIAWLIAGQSAEFSIGIGIAVLVVSCPCALGLATPVAITVGVGRSASDGILIKSAEALEILHSVDTVVLDKTGTITVGKPSVTDILTDLNEADFIRIAASLEAPSEHPLSRAIAEHAADIPKFSCTDWKAVFGRGVTGKIENAVYFAGNRAYMEESGVGITGVLETADKLAAAGKTPLYFAKEKNFIGLIAVADTVKETSRGAITRLKSLGIRVIMLTGDNKITAEAIGRQMDIDETVADVLPENKEAVVASLKEKGRRVCMVGDGINDSPALTRADVGIAIGSGTDIAIDSADVVLMKSDLNGVPNSVAYSKRVMKNIRENLFWAFFYNVLGIPVAAGVLFPAFGIIMSPMIASAAMSLSSVFVVSNALRLYKKRKQV